MRAPARREVVQVDLRSEPQCTEPLVIPQLEIVATMTHTLTNRVEYHKNKTNQTNDKTEINHCVPGGPGEDPPCRPS